ncbi:MAG TPA: putative sugar nucleotidyl transferase [Spirochaetota bacterium]|nr:putative sugar nucleotidyl transferase [Spirochaetota bacterium]
MMPFNILIADFNKENYYPLSLTRPLWTLRSGCFEQHERFRKLFQDDKRLTFLASEEMCSLYSDIRTTSTLPAGEDILIINSLMNIIPDISDLNKSEVFYNRNVLAYAFIKKDDLIKISVSNGCIESLTGFSKNITDIIFPKYIWEIPLMNGEIIKNDFKFFSEKSNCKITVSGPEKLFYCSDSAEIEPFVSVSTKKGPVIIDENAEISSFSRIEGPAYIGKNTCIFRANIREGSSFGISCRIGGEVEDSVFNSFSNKYHDGFIGHAYIGSWVNLGAMTTNSDLKNDYTNVKVNLDGKLHDSESPKVGAVVGDFVKTSIGTLINTGSVIGSCSMTVFSGRMTPDFIPPFSLFIKNKLRSAKSFDSVISTIKTQMSRRGCNLSPEHKSILRNLYEKTLKDNLRIFEEWNKKLN